MGGMSHDVELGTVQETMLLTLAHRAADTRKRHPVLRDPKAVEIINSLNREIKEDSRFGLTVLRTASYDSWVRAFLDRDPAGTVVELGTGLNTRFDRVDNGQVHWIDLDLPDSIALRRKFFTDTDRRRMMAASALSPEWLDTVAELPGPYLFVTEGVLVYLPRAEVEQMLTRIAERFPGALIGFDTYRKRAFEMHAREVTKGRLTASWSWFCENPREFESLGLRLVDSATLSRPPRDVADQLSLAYRLSLSALHPVLKRFFDLSLFRAPKRPDGEEPGS
jgi:O-methyltransferase involved in polyketide biosynthesis